MSPLINSLIKVETPFKIKLLPTLIRVWRHENDTIHKYNTHKVVTVSFARMSHGDK